jgi:hypothetical protein
MEISVKFSAEELRLIWQALKLGSIHNPDEAKAEEMSDLMKRVEMLGMITKHETEKKA